MREDLDNNHSGNAAVSGATITLLDSIGVVIATTVSDSSGGARNVYSRLKLT